MYQALRENKIWSYFSLFSSLSTLFCCALPSLFVVLGMGSTLAGLIGTFPQLVWFSEHKGLVFGLSFLMLGISYYSQKKAAACPIDQKENCEDAKSWSKPLMVVALILNLIGVTFAYVIPNL
jgi:hypothetical protein